MVGPDDYTNASDDAGLVFDGLRLVARELRRIRHTLERFGPQGAAATIDLTATIVPKEGPTMSPLAPISTDTNNNLELAAVAKDKAGATVPDTLTYASSNPAVASVAPDPADPTKQVATLLTPGSTTITVSDPAGVTTSVDVTVTQGAAATIELTATVVPKA